MDMTDQIVKEVWGKSSKRWLALLLWGALGGILMIWNEDKVEVVEHEVGAFSISVHCGKINVLEDWVNCGINGSVIAGEVDEFLGELDNVKARWDLPWCIGGDFNLVRFTHKRERDNRRDSRMEKFGNFINRWNLIDIPSKRGKMYLV